ncbi:MAG: Crp/Fnr family transcriptional regulator [Myxococcales bacterium]|nr:Crp/Fnr family transcriptional regulator [Myxococcales bacterium]
MNAAQLQTVPGLVGLSDRDAVALAGMGVDRWFRAGSTVGEADHPDTGALLVVAGEAKLLLEVADLSLPFATLSPGDWWNCDAIYEHATSPFSLRALTDVKAFVVLREQLAELGARPAAMGQQLLRAMLLAQLRIAQALAPHAVRWQQTAAAKRKPNRKDILDLGMAKLVAAVARGEVQPHNQVEVIGHQGAAVAASFRQNR